jgi:hypothetical protein
MPTRFFEFLLEVSHSSELAALCQDREGLQAAMDSYGLTEAERRMVLNAMEPAGRSEDVVRAYRKADEIVKAYRRVEGIAAHALP